MDRRDVGGESAGQLVPSPWVISDDVAANEASVRRLAAELPPVEVLAPGHGEPIRADGNEALRRLAARL